MLSELAALFSACPEEATREEMLEAIVGDNALGKATTSTRRLTAQRLSELYGLDRDIPIYRGFRRYWDASPDGQELLALLAALARDPLLRSTAASILDLREGQSYDRERMKEALTTAVKDRLNEATLDKVARNAASSWTQSQHLEGRTFKKRQLVKPTKGAVAMALFLGFLQGVRGPGILTTFWCRVLDAPPIDLARIATSASLAGLLRFRQSGEVVDVSFPNLLSKAELEVVYESNRNPRQEV